MKKIGFAHGVLYRIADKYSKSTMDVYVNCGMDVIEVSINNLSEVKNLNNIVQDVKNFKYRSIHLPQDQGIIYKNDEKTVELLDNVSNFYKEINADLILVHPDVVKDWKVFDQYKLNWAIENLSPEKEGYKTVDELAEFLKMKPDWKLVLDLNHCYSNDQTMKLADDMISQFKDRIAEIHLSGYVFGSTNYHDSLFITKQDFILDYCKKLDVPIIIESIFDRIEDVQKEYEYITNYLK